MGAWATCIRLLLPPRTLALFLVRALAYLSRRSVDHGPLIVRPMQESRGLRRICLVWSLELQTMLDMSDPSPNF